MTEKISHISIESDEDIYERLLALGVPEERAKDWARLGPKMRASLWTNGPVGVWEVHRELSAHLRIAGWTLLDTDQMVCEAEQARRVREIVLALCDEMRSRRFPLMKADSWADEGIFVDVLRSIGCGTPILREKVRIWWSLPTNTRRRNLPAVPHVLL